MKRQRFVNLLLAAACVIMTGITLRQYSVPLVPAADAQGGVGQTDSLNGSERPNFKPATPAIRKAAATAIRSQLQAFAKNDYQTAVKYQSRELRGNFPSVDRFKQMITRAYPEFAHFKSVKFQDVLSTPNGNRALVQVVLKGQNGRTVNAFYRLILEGNGYKIEGVEGGGSHPSLPPAPGTTVNA